MRISGRDGSGGALDRYEPINLQIGHSDLVSILDSLKGLRRQDSANVAPMDAN